MFRFLHTLLEVIEEILDRFFKFKFTFIKQIIVLDKYLFFRKWYYSANAFGKEFDKYKV